MNSEFRLIKELGRGGTSIVYLGQSVSNPRIEVAVKIYKPEWLRESKGAWENVKNEINVLEKISHKNVINVMMYGDNGVISFPKTNKTTSGVAFLVTEYVNGTLLFDISKDLGKLGESVGLFFLRQIVDVLKYLHKSGVAHRDLKLENIMVDKEMNIKIIDFGFASE